MNPERMRLLEELLYIVTWRKQVLEASLSRTASHLRACEATVELLDARLRDTGRSIDALQSVPAGTTPIRHAIEALSYRRREDAASSAAACVARTAARESMHAAMAGLAATKERQSLYSRMLERAATMAGEFADDPE